MPGSDPLHELLERLLSGQPHTIESVARDLHVDVAMVEQMLETLERAGYVQCSGLVCNGACDRCPSSGGCHLLHNSRIWSVTERGRRALVTQ